MKFNVQSSVLLSQLQAVNKVINTKNAIQILDNFLFKVEGDKLYITGTDQENVMTAVLDITDSDGDGIIAIPAKRLIDTIKELPAQGITFFINDATKDVGIMFLNGQFNFMGVDAAEYPQRDENRGEKRSFQISSDVILKGLDNTLFATASDTLRPIMTGIFWDIHMNDITFVSSDTHKLVKYVNKNVSAPSEMSFILPPKPASILHSIIGKEPETVTVEVDDKGATFRFATIELVCRFINGKYPPYNRVIPQQNPYVLTVDRESFLRAAKRVGLFASLASNLISISISEQEIMLSARDYDYATSAEERVVCSYQGDPMIIGFSSVYLIELLSNLSGDEIVLNLSEPSRPGLFEPAEQKDNENVLMLLMPIQVPVAQ